MCVCDRMDRCEINSSPHLYCHPQILASFQLRCLGFVARKKLQELREEERKRNQTQAEKDAIRREVEERLNRPVSFVRQYNFETPLRKISCDVG